MLRSSMSGPGTSQLQSQLREPSSYQYLCPCTRSFQVQKCCSSTSSWIPSDTTNPLRYTLHTTQVCRSYHSGVSSLRCVVHTHQAKFVILFFQTIFEVHSTAKGVAKDVMKSKRYGMSAGLVCMKCGYYDYDCMVQ